MSARDVIAKQIEPQAWAALGVGDTIAYRNRRVSSERKADRICAALTAAGYVMLSPDEVRGIRDEALEEAAREAKSWEQTARKLSRRESDKERSLYHSLAGDMARDIAGAIRSLKGGRDAQ